MLRFSIARMRNWIAQHFHRASKGRAAFREAQAWRERASSCRDFIDSLLWRRAHRGRVCDETTEEGHFFVVMSLFLRPINIFAVLLALFSAASFIARFFLHEGLPPSKAISPSEWAGFAISGGLLLSFAGFNAWVFIMEHRAWMLRHPTDILALRERRVITWASGKRARLAKRSPRL